MEVSDFFNSGSKSSCFFCKAGTKSKFKANMAALDYKALMKLERDAYLKQPVRHSEGSSSKDKDKVQVSGRRQVKADFCAENGRNWNILPPEHSYEPLVGEISSLCFYSGAVDDDTAVGLLETIDKIGADQGAWIQLKARRLQCWGDFPKSTSGSNSTEDLSAPMPGWLTKMIDCLVEQGVFSPEQRPNNVLINQYSANEGILHHTDGPAYHDKVAILSLDSDCIMSFRRKLGSDEIGTEFAGNVCSVVLTPRSLLVFEGDAYSKYMHGIEIDQPVQRVEEHGPCANLHLVALPTDTDGNHIVTRGQRTSITFRRLRNV